jgi:predicted ATPase/DNA-binding CsgD family transcriptional regulator
MPDSLEQETFTERERTILQYIAEGWTNREIADELFISVNTVRWYNKQIYSKLGVHSRTLAIARARELGLLSLGAEAQATADAGADSAAQTESPDTADTELPATLRHNLPNDLTPFIGRERELIEITDWLKQPQTRLLTITGPGGIGKTRLALEVARAQIDYFVDGVYLVPLAPLTPLGYITSIGTTDDFILSAIASALGLSFHTGKTPAEQLTHYLHDQQVLLVMDNFEHLLDGIGVIRDLLTATTHVKLLATSRENLGVYGEIIYPVGGMALARDDQNAPQNESIRLFLQCAQRARANFTVQNGDMGHIADICARVGGLPLGIELAAAWVRSLSLADIVEELAHGLDILETRTYSIRAAFDRSWDMLTPAEQQTFGRMAVFAGSCTREAARHITGASLQMLTALVDKSLVWHVDGRYSMHELLRQYGQEKLQVLGKEALVHEQHCAYYAALAARWGRELSGGQQIAGLAAIDQELDNIRAAWQYALKDQNLEALEQIIHIWRFFEIRTRWYEGNEWFRQAVANWEGDQNNLVYARLLAAQGQFTWRLGLWDQAMAQIEHSLELFEHLGAEAESLPSRLNKGNLIAMRGDMETGERIYRETLALAEKHQDHWTQSLLIGNLSIAAESKGDYTLAEQLLRQQIEIAEAHGDRATAALAHLNLGEIALRQQQYPRAAQYARRSLELARSLDHQYILANSMNRLGTVARAQHHPAEARRLIEEALAINRKNGNRYYMISGLNNLALTLRAEGDTRRAWQCIREGLALAREINTLSLSLELLLTAAHILLDDGEFGRAIELLTVVEQHPATRHIHDRDTAQQLREDLQSELPEQLFSEAVQRGAQLTLDAVMDQILAD